MGMCCLAPFTGISLPHVIALICYLRMRPPKQDSPVMHSGNCNKNKTNQMAKPWRRRRNFFPDVHAWLFGTRTLFQDVSGSCKGAHSSPTNAQPHTHTHCLSSRLHSCNSAWSSFLMPSGATTTLPFCKLGLQRRLGHRMEWPAKLFNTF